MHALPYRESSPQVWLRLVEQAKSEIGYADQSAHGRLDLWIALQVSTELADDVVEQLAYGVVLASDCVWVGRTERVLHQADHRGGTFSLTLGGGLASFGASLLLVGAAALRFSFDERGLGRIGLSERISLGQARTVRLVRMR